MTGETWKLTAGHRLLEGDEDSEFENSSQASFETINGEAARRQNLPKFSTEISPAARPLLRKEVPDLPEEPSETAEEVVTVALRCPNGRVLRRRFFKSWNSQVRKPMFSEILSYEICQHCVQMQWETRPHRQTM